MSQSIHRPTVSLSRRRFTHMLGAGAAAALAPLGVGRARGGGIPAAEQAGALGERYWEQVRGQFLMPDDLAVLNAANLCPSSMAVLDKLHELTRDVDRNPSMQNRQKLKEGKERARRTVAKYLRAQPEEILLTRNTSEGNNIVSSGIDLGAEDEVVIFGDNHPSNHRAWTDKATRFGFSVKVVEQKNPHPGGDYYVEAFLGASSARTRLWAFTHLTNSVGDLFPVEEMCRVAKERGILTLVDGAQTLGVLDLDLGKMSPDFYTGSGHKWPCGPRETGVLYVNEAVQSRLSPSVISLYGGTVGISETHENFGQRDEPAVIALGEAVELQMSIGRDAIARRSRELAQAAMEGLSGIDGVKLWTHPDRSWAVVSFQPGDLDPQKLSAALYERDGIACATRGGDRPGLRFSPHFYNLHAEVERAVAAVAGYVKRGLPS